MDVFIIRIEQPGPPRILVRAASDPWELFKNLALLYPNGIQRCSWQLARDLSSPEFRMYHRRQEVCS